MHLEAIDLSLLKRAVRVFLGEAWGDLADAHWPRKLGPQTLSRDDALKAFVATKNGNLTKYSLRLGNRRYPFMKMIFEELLFRGSYYFAVDTHDELDIKDSVPDYGEWLAIREHNAKVKREVERAWREAGIPTLEGVLEDIDCAGVPECEICPLAEPPLVLIVDDEKCIAEGVRRILVRRRYRVQVAHSAEEALQFMATQVPDLVVSDLEMGAGLNGLELRDRIRKNPKTAQVPFILATAAGIDFTGCTLIDGFLIKPYDIGSLITFVAKHVQPAKK